MGEALLKAEELEAIGVYVKSHLNDWLGETNIVPFAKQLELTEKMAGFEAGLLSLGEQLKLQLHLMDKRFEQVDKRFEQVDKRFEQVDKRFEQVDKRFEEMRQDTNARCEQVDSRFKQMFAYITTTFVLLAVLMSVYQFLG